MKKQWRKKKQDENEINEWMNEWKKRPIWNFLHDQTTEKYDFCWVTKKRKLAKVLKSRKGCRCCCWRRSCWHCCCWRSSCCCCCCCRCHHVSNACGRANDSSPHDAGPIGGCRDPRQVLAPKFETGKIRFRKRRRFGSSGFPGNRCPSLAPMFSGVPKSVKRVKTNVPPGCFLKQHLWVF